MRTSPLIALVGALSLLLVSAAKAQPTTSLVSVAADGGRGNASSPAPVAVSADGRFIAFYSWATNLVERDTNGVSDVFVRDMQAGVTTLVSVASDGTQGNSDSFGASLSADGRYVAFCSNASNLVPGDSNGVYDAFVHDLQTGQTSRVSVASDGAQGNGISYEPRLSGDGRHVGFYSSATNLVSGDTNGVSDTFVHNMQTGVTSLVSVSSDGSQGNGPSTAVPALSFDGRYIAFECAASNLVPNDTSGYYDVFLRDTQAGTTVRVSVTSYGEQANNNSESPAISADGRWVVYVSYATNLVSGDANGLCDVFIYDSATGLTNLVSVASDGTQGNAAAYSPSVSDDGGYVAFHSAASNFVADDTNGVADVFVREVRAGVTARESVAADGIQANGYAYFPRISPDGRFVSFVSRASNLAPGAPYAEDVYTRGPLPIRPAYIQQPGLAAAGDVFLQAPRLRCPGAVSVAIKGGTGAPSATLSGTTSQDPIEGVAAFPDLAIDKPGEGYVLVATSDGLSAESQPFDVLSASPHLAFAIQPARAEAGTPFGQQPILLARDPANLLLPDFDWPVRLAIRSGTGSPGAALVVGTATGVGGVVTFAGVSIDRSGNGYVLDAFVGPNKLGESEPFDVAPKAERLVLTAQPGGATDDWPFTMQPAIEVQDVSGERASLYNGPVTLAIQAGTGTAGATLTGVTTVNAVHGVAAFAGLRIPRIGAGYVLVASAPGLVDAACAPFDVTEAPKLLLKQVAPDALEVSVRPAGRTMVGATFTLAWSALDLKAVRPPDVVPGPGWMLVDAEVSSGLMVSLASEDGVSADGPAATVRLAAQPALSGRSAPVTVTGDSTLLNDSWDTFPILPRTVGFIPGAHLVFTKQPMLTAAGQRLAGPPTVAVMDGTDTVVRDYIQPVAIRIAPGTGETGAVLDGTSPIAAVEGLAAFTDLTIDRKGTGYVLAASTGSMEAQSVPFDIAPQARRLVFTTQPGRSRAGLPLAPVPVVTVQDDDGATAVAFSGPVTLAIKPGSGFPGTTLEGMPALNAIAGKAVFTDLRIPAAAPGYVLTASAVDLLGAESDGFDVVPFAFTVADAVDSLRWAGGLAVQPIGFQQRFDVVVDGRLDIADAARIARKAFDLDTNP